MNGIGRTHGSASSEQAWESMATSSVNFCRKTRTVHVARLPPSFAVSNRKGPSRWVPALGLGLGVRLWLRLRVG
jgi:hypothetical protein